MAEAIGVAILSAIGTTAAVSTTVGIAGVSLATIVGTTAILGTSAAISALTTPDTTAKVQAQQLSSRQSRPIRRRAYGLLILAGPKIEWKSYQGTFTNAIYHCEGPIAGYEAFFLADTRTALPPGSLGGPSGVAPWGNYVQIEGHRGTDDQAASALLTMLPGWTAQNRLAGCAYSVTRSAAASDKKFKNIYTSGTWPEHRAQIRASLVRDVRDPLQTADPATWKWSDRVTPCVRDLITHGVWGMKVPDALMDDASFKVSTDVDDEPIVDREGKTYPRWYLGGSYELNEDPAGPLQAMLDAGDKRLFLTPAGKIGITGGRYVPPEVTIGHDCIISMGEIEVGTGKRAAVNRLKLSFVSPAHGYELVEGDPLDDLDAQDEAGETLEADFTRSWVQNHFQLRRLAKIHMARSNPEFRITGLVTNRGGLPALFEDVVLLDLPRYGIRVPCEIQRGVAAGDGSICTFDLVSIDPDAWTIKPGDEGTPPPVPGTDALPDAPAPPVDLAATIEQRAVNAGLNAVFLRLTADEPEREDQSLIGRYREVGAADWLDMVAEGDNRGSVISSVLADGGHYEAQGAITGYGRSVQSPWMATDPVSLIATADTVSPGPPTDVSVQGGAGILKVSLVAPNAANFGFIRLYRGNATSSFAQAVVIQTLNGAPSQGFDLEATSVQPGEYRLWLRAFNRSGFPRDPVDLSSTIGPLTVTVT